LRYSVELRVLQRSSRARADALFSGCYNGLGQTPSRRKRVFYAVRLPAMWRRNRSSGDGVRLLPRSGAAAQLASYHSSTPACTSSQPRRCCGCSGARWSHSPCPGEACPVGGEAGSRQCRLCVAAVRRKRSCKSCGTRCRAESPAISAKRRVSSRDLRPAMGADRGRGAAGIPMAERKEGFLALGVVGIKRAYCLTL